MSFLLTAIASILIFGLVILIHELGHFLVAKKSGIQVNEFSIGMGPAILKRVRGGTQYSLRALPIGGFVAMEGEDEDGTEEPEKPAVPPTGKPFSEVSIWKRMATIAAGGLMNLLLGLVVCLILVCMQSTIVSRTIASFTEGALCQQTGLQVDDKILSVNGRRCFVANDIVYELARTENHAADFTVLRGDEVVQLHGVQFDTTTAEDGSVKMQLGFKVYPAAKTVGNVLKETGNTTLYYMRLILLSLSDLVTGRAGINDLSGPVGIVSVIGQAVGLGLGEVLSILALITINLGIFNLLPLPALDGGKQLLLLVEAIIHRPVPTRVQAAINATGMVLLLGLMLFVTFNDVLRLL